MSDGETRASPEVQEQEPEGAPETTQEAQEQEPQVEAAEPVADPEPQPAEPEEGKGAEGAEGPEGDKEEEGAAKAEDKEEEGAEKPEEKAAEEDKKEEEEVKEEPIKITHEDNRFWLSNEDVLAKGLPESEVENFKNFYFKHAHSLQSFYEVLKDYTVPIEFVTLSKEEIEALTVEGDVSEEQQQVLDGLRDRINAVIELYEEAGALVKVNGRTGKDSVLDKNEEAFTQTIRDAVINSLEVDKQSSSAYAVWKDQEHHPGAFKRGMNKLRASFRRSRAGSAGERRRRPKLEEEKKDEDAPKDEEKTEEPKSAEGEEAAPKAEGEAAEGGATEVTVEVDVEASDKPEEAATTEEPKEEAAEPKEEAEAPKEEEPKEEAAAEPPKEEEGDKKEEEGDKKEEEGDKKEEEGDKKEGEEGDKKEEEGDKKEDGEIQAAAAAEGGEKVKRKSTRRKQKPAEEHQFKEAKNEPLDNQVLRAFGRVMGSYYRVKDGKAALEQLRSSAQIKNELNKLKAFGGVEGVQVSLSVCRWEGQICDQNGMIFRAFVYNNELTALSQYNDGIYFPNVVHYKDSVISGKVQQFFQDSIKEALKDLENYIIDFFVAPDKLYVLRLNPFYTNIGACLFTWTEDARTLTKEPMEFRVVTTPKTAEAYSSYQNWWEDMLKSVLQQRKGEQTRSSKCIIL